MRRGVTVVICLCVCVSLTDFGDRVYQAQNKHQRKANDTLFGLKKLKFCKSVLSFRKSLSKFIILYYTTHQERGRGASRAKRVTINIHGVANAWACKVSALA